MYIMKCGHGVNDDRASDFFPSFGMLCSLSVLLSVSMVSLRN